jgi:hypothetical protein
VLDRVREVMTTSATRSALPTHDSAIGPPKLLSCEFGSNHRPAKMRFTVLSESVKYDVPDIYHRPDDQVKGENSRRENLAIETDIED